MPLDHSPISRRTVAKGAAWSVPAVAVAGSAPALAASPTECGTQSVSITLTYSVSDALFGDQGVWTVTVSTVLPTCVHVGESIPAPSLTVEVVTSEAAADRMRALGVSSLSGTGESPYTVEGAVVGSPQSRTANLTIPETSVPPDPEVITTVGTGTGTVETAAASPGTININVGDGFTATMTTNTGVTLNLTGTLDPATQATLLGTIDVIA